MPPSSLCSLAPSPRGQQRERGKQSGKDREGSRRQGRQDQRWGCRQGMPRQRRPRWRVRWAQGKDESEGPGPRPRGALRAGPAAARASRSTPATLSYTLPSKTLNRPRCPEFSFTGPGERPGFWPEGHPVPERAWTLPSLPGPRMACATLLRFLHLARARHLSGPPLHTGTLSHLSANACPVPGLGHLCREQADTAPAPRDRDAHETVGAQGGDAKQPRQSGEIPRGTGSSDRGESSQQRGGGSPRESQTTQGP